MGTRGAQQLLCSPALPAFLRGQTPLLRGGVMDAAHFQQVDTGIAADHRYFCV